jgi:hypothetical protein
MASVSAGVGLRAALVPLRAIRADEYGASAGPAPRPAQDEAVRAREHSVLPQLLWSGHIVGFDHDGPDIFERQIMLVEQARIITAMVGMLSAIPKTPLHARPAREGRLDTSDRPDGGTNVIPLGLSREQLRQGYVQVMQRLYAPEAYFNRVRTLYLEGPLANLQHWPRRSRMASIKWTIKVAAFAAFIVLRLQTRVDDRSLRKVYRGVIGEALRQRSVLLPQILATKCAMHYHAARLVREIAASARPVNTI